MPTGDEAEPARHGVAGAAALLINGTECDHHGCTGDMQDHWSGLPNAITLARTIAAVVLCLFAAAAATSWPWLLAALATYWLGDIADGLLARLTGSETRTGAVLDILGDRVSVCLIITVYGTTHPEVLVPAGVFLVQFVVVDAYLSLMFFNWSLLSPNYFHLVDRLVYRWNWSLPAKAFNTGAVVVAWLLTRSAVVATIAAVLVLSIKIFTAFRLTHHRPPLVRSGCAVDEAAASSHL